jgi:hypothetical protein
MSLTGIGEREPRGRGRPPKKVTVIDKAPHEEQLLTTEEAAALTKMSVAWFKRCRWQHVGPPYRTRGRRVRYLKTELLDWFSEMRSTDFGGGP